MTAAAPPAIAATPRRGFRIRHFPGVTPVAACFFAYLYLPILVLFALSFNKNVTVTVWTGFTFDWYHVVLGNDDILRAARNSLVIAVSAATSATVIATAAALAMARSRFRGQAAATATLALPLVVPEIVTAVATLLFFATVGIQLGHLTVILAHTVFCIPFAYLPIRARLEGMDRAVVEAAADLYANELADLPPRHLPAAAAGHPVRPGPGVHYLAGRFCDNLLRVRRRGDHPAGLHLRHGAHRHHAGSERGLHADDRGLGAVRDRLVPAVAGPVLGQCHHRRTDAVPAT